MVRRWPGVPRNTVGWKKESSISMTVVETPATSVSPWEDARCPSARRMVGPLPVQPGARMARAITSRAARKFGTKSVESTANRLEFVRLAAPERPSGLGAHRLDRALHPDHHLGAGRWRADRSPGAGHDRVGASGQQGHLHQGMLAVV